MKYEILGFNQNVIVQLNSQNSEISLDLQDLLILEWIKNNTGKYAHELKFIDNKVYTWITYKNVLEDLPILDIAEKRLYQRIKKYKDFGLVDIITQCEQGIKGSKTYVCREELFETLWIDQSKKIYGGNDNQSKNIYGGQPDQSKNIYSQYNNINNINNNNNNNIKTISKDIVGENRVNKSSSEDCNSPQVAPSTSKNTSSTKINLGKKLLVNTNKENTLKSIVKEPIARKETENKVSNKEVKKLAVANKAIEIATKQLNLTDLEIIETVKDWFANCYEQKGMSTSDTRFRYALESLQSVIEKFPKETVLKLVKQAILRSHITLEYVIQEFNKPKYNNKNDIYKFPGMRDNETVDEYLARKKKEEQENKAYVESVKEEIRTGNKTGQWV